MVSFPQSGQAGTIGIAGHDHKECVQFMNKYLRWLTLLRNVNRIGILILEKL